MGISGISVLYSRMVVTNIKMEKVKDPSKVKFLNV